jgi:protein-disulfide isomerase
VARSPAPSRSSSAKPLLLVLGVVALALGGFLAYRALGKEKPATEPVQVVLSQADLNRVKGISVGREDAPVVIWEFADFQCPGCASFAWQVAPLIKQKLVESGKARFVFYDFPIPSIHPHAFLAARAGRCANEQGRFWEFHDITFGKQSRWSRASDPTEMFIEFAEQAGADRQKFEACLRSDRYAREVTESMQFGQSQGVEGTPTVFVNGKRLQDIGDFKELERIVEAESGSAPAADTAAADTSR